MMANGCEVSLGGDDSILELDGGDIVNVLTVPFQMVHFMSRDFYPNL